MIHRRRKISDLPPLPTTSRLLVLILGWLMIGLGVAGLVLPGIQGVVTIVVGAAFVSLVSQTMLNVVRWCFRPWPRAWRRVLGMRRRVHGWFRPGSKVAIPLSEITKSGVGSKIARRSPPRSADTEGVKPEADEQQMGRRG